MKYLLIALLFSLMGCGNNLSIEGDFGNKQFDLLTQDGEMIEFPKLIEGNIAIVGYIFTNCPDICPLTTNNMKRLQDKLNEKNINGVEFVSISFDPEVDRPNVLKKYAELRNLDESNWTFLTGEKEDIKRLIKAVNVVAVVGDSTVTPQNEKIYYYVHTDRISLVDKKGNIRKSYIGSNANIEEIFRDVKSLVE
ncbi:MAG: SCO family protein [Ignavibacteria bacterium]|jgi:protein SCO1/2